MAQVFISCPRTGEPVYTGLNFDWFSLDSIELIKASIHCRECGEDHAWTKTDAFLRADGGEN